MRKRKGRHPPRWRPVRNRKFSHPHTHETHYPPARAGHQPESVRTDAACTVEKVGEGFKITTMRLTVRARCPGIDDAAFQAAAEATRKGCPVSQALAGVEISVEATLES